MSAETSVTTNGTALTARIYRVNSARIALNIVKSYKRNKLIYINNPAEFAGYLLELLTPEERNEVFKNWDR